MAVTAAVSAPVPVRAPVTALVPVPRPAPARGWEPDGRDPQVEVALAHLTRPLPDDVVARVLARLDGDRRHRLARLARREDVERGLVGDVLASMLVAARTGAAPSRIGVRRAASGAPRVTGVPGTQGSQHVSLSHCGAWVACAASTRPVGVDVEGVRPLSPVAVAAMLPGGAAGMLPGAEPARSRQAVRIWTAVEAYLKMLGTGLRIPPGDVHLDVLTGGLALLRGPAGAPRAAVHLDDADAGHALAVCAAGATRPPSVRITRISTSRLVAGYLWDDVPTPLRETGAAR
jgi:4'-phosphopantetheinyl transferase